MNTLILDNMIDTPGVLATAHTPLIGEAISAQSTASGVITDANRMRGQAQGTLVYSKLPASGIYTIEAEIYVASNSNGIGISLSGALLSFSNSNGYWNLAGTGIPSGQHVDQTLNPGETHKLKLAATAGNVLTAYVDGAQIIQKTSSQAIAAGPAGFFFLGTDTNSTGYHLQNFIAYESAPAVVDLDGTFLCDGGGSLYVASDNEFYLIGLIDRIAGAYVRGATVTAQVTTLDGTPVGSPVTLSFVSGSITVPLPNAQTRTSADGNYIGQLPASTPLVDGTTYYVKTTATSGSNQRVFRGSYSGAYSTN